MGVARYKDNFEQPVEIKNLQVTDNLTIGTSATTQYISIENTLDVGMDSAGLRNIDGINGPTLTAPAAVFSISNPDSFAQIAFKNTADGTSSSTDFIAYANNGDDNSGYIDMGITSNNFSDPAFTITGANDGYIFMGAPKPYSDITSAIIVNGIVTITTAQQHGFSAGSVVRVETYAARQALQYGSYYNVTIVNVLNEFQFALDTTSSTLVSSDLSNLADVYMPSGQGNLVIATDATGSQNNIVFAAGGLATDTTQMTIYPNSKININLTTPSTSTSTGALTINGGLGILGNINLGGYLKLASGSVTLAPLSFSTTSLSLLTTQAGGSIEYDGFVFYATPNINATNTTNVGRGIIQAPAVYYVNTATSITNSTTEQKLLQGLTTGGIHLSQGAYEVDALIYLTNSGATTTSHGISFRLSGITGSTATLTSSTLLAVSNILGAAANGTSVSTTFIIAPATVTQLASAVATKEQVVSLKGTIRVGTAGILVPSIQFTTASPGGTTTLGAGSYIKFSPLTSSTSANLTNAGAWV